MNKDARTKADSARSGRRNPNAAKRSARSTSAGARRTWIVLLGLFAGLSFTGALLKALAPPPLSPDSPASLLAVTQEQSIDELLQAPASTNSGRWKAIYVHQSLTESGNAQSLAKRTGGLPDHFVIGNGGALGDGAIQTGPRWSQQLPAGAVQGVRISPDCLSICLVGNFNRTRPTAMQQARLLELIAGLERELGVNSDEVEFGWEADQTSPAGVGIRFPLAALRSQLP